MGQRTGEAAYANHLETISAVLFGDRSQFGVVRDYVLGFTKQGIGPVAAFVFQSGIDITAVENILRPLRTNDRKAADKAITLLGSVPQELVAATVGEPAWEDLIALVEQGFSQPSSPTAKRIWHGVIALAGLLSVYRRDRLDLSDVKIGTSGLWSRRTCGCRRVWTKWANTFARCRRTRSAVT